MILQLHSHANIWNKKTQKATCTSKFTAALFMTVKTWKQSACPLADEWIEKMWYVYTVVYYSAIKRNGILPFAASWMDLEGIALSEIGQTEEDKHCMISLHVVSKKYNMLVNTT